MSDVRAEIAKTLGDWAAAEGMPGLHWEPYADALAPLVDRLCAERAAQEVRPELIPFPAHGCDWGGCDDDSPWLRWAPDLGAYLAVCERHARSGLDGRPPLRLAAALTATEEAAP